MEGPFHISKKSSTSGIPYGIMLQYTPSYLSHILIQAVADGGHGVSQGGGGGVGGRGKREWGVAVRGGVWPSM